MRLAYILGTYPHPSETFIDREVAGLRSRGHQLDIFSIFPPASGLVEGVTYGWTAPLSRIRRKLFPAAEMRNLACRWRTCFHERGYHAIIAHFASYPSTLAMEAAGELPLIISMHARDLYVEAERLQEKVAQAAAVVTCTEANRAYLCERFPAWAGKIHRIYHGLPSTWLAMPVPSSTRRSHEPLRMVAAGRFVEKKGFHMLLDACARLRSAGFPFSLMLIGDGPQLHTLVRRRDDLGLQNSVTISGWMDEADLRASFAQADLLCCPSLIAADGDRDGLPNVLLEAMACGLPVLASDLPGIAEAVEDGVTGFLISPGNSQMIATTIIHRTDLATLSHLGSNAAARVRERFNGEKHLAQFEALLARIVLPGQ